jgi:hypothetical protein
MHQQNPDFFMGYRRNAIDSKERNRSLRAGYHIKDWPDTKVRAVHYDTKHHQDKRSYVESMIRDLAAYKINMLAWEWEDKFEYPSHPGNRCAGCIQHEGNAGIDALCTTISYSDRTARTRPGTRELHFKMAAVRSFARNSGFQF